MWHERNVLRKRRCRSLFSLLALLFLLFAAAGAGIAGGEAADGTAETDVTRYAYTVRPVLSPFYYCVYIRTENPDPLSFRLRDPQSIYAVKGKDAFFVQKESLYADVKYEDASVYRVKGGYVFQYLSSSAYSDGGDLVLQQRISGSGGSAEYADTDVTVSCPGLRSSLDVLIDRYTDSSMDFFEKLDAISAALDRIAVYPRSVKDSSSPNTALPWPFLASSPYPEMALNDHYEMYNDYEGNMLLQIAYPYVLDSLGYPGIIAAAARRFEPECTVSTGSAHYIAEITWNGETRTYGGAGKGGNDPICTDRLEPVFTFDESGSGLGTEGTVEDYSDKLYSYQEPAAEDAEKSRDLIEGETFQKTIRSTGGTWIRIATEGIGYGQSFAYEIPTLKGVKVVSDAWVDGRYVSSYERLYFGAHFSDYPHAGIVLPRIRYTDINGVEHIQDLLYTYRPSTDRWEASMRDFYTGSYSDETDVPDAFILTRDQVEEMVLDSKTNSFPATGLNYDGRSEPGSAFHCATLLFYESEDQIGTENFKAAFYDLGTEYILPDRFTFSAPEVPGMQLTFRAWAVQGQEYAEKEPAVFDGDARIVARWDSWPDIALNSENFPDEAFRKIAASYDLDGSGVLSHSELVKVTRLDCTGAGISSLNGIGYFTELKSLVCSNNSLTELDLSGNALLTSLSCSDNSLTRLDVSGNALLMSLSCSNNSLARLDVSRNGALTWLTCSSNRIEELDVSGNPKLVRLVCSENQLRKLTLSRNTELAVIECQQNALAELDTGEAPNLTELFCYQNGLTRLDLSGNPLLSDLRCYRNSIAELDVSGSETLSRYVQAMPRKKDYSESYDEFNDGSLHSDFLRVDQTTAVKAGDFISEATLRKIAEINEVNFPDEHFRKIAAAFDRNQNGELDNQEADAAGSISCADSSIASLQGIAFFGKLTALDCHGNDLTELDLSHNILLTRLNCSKNSLARLDLGSLPELAELICCDNQLAELDVSGCRILSGYVQDHPRLRIPHSLQDGFSDESPEFSCFLVDSGTRVTAAGITSDPIPESEDEPGEQQPEEMIGPEPEPEPEEEQEDHGSGDASETDRCAKHKTVLHAAVDPSCTAAGNLAYWSCSGCGRYFSDAAGEHEIAAGSWTVAATGHTLTEHPAVPATCTAAGLEAYWRCDACGRLFSDPEGRNEIDAPVEIAAKGHQEATDAAVPPTFTETGLTEGKHCSRCGEVLVPQETVPKLEKEILPGDVNEDGETDGRDAVLLMKYLAKETDKATGSAYEINEDNADVTGDGIVDSKDLLRLVRYLGGEKVTLEKGKVTRK